METLKVEANYRSDMTKSHMKKLRRDGYATGSVFGRDTEPVSVEVKLEDLVKQVKHAEAGVKSLIELKIKGAPGKSDGLVIIKGFHRDPLTRKVLDLQFQRVSLKEKVHVGVPIEVVGEAPGTKEGGILEQLIDELQVSCLPTEIPPRIEVDVSGLAIGQHLRVSDLSLPPEIEVLMDAETLICNCRPPHIVHVEEEVEEAAPEEEAEAVAAEAEKTEEQAADQA